MPERGPRHYPEKPDPEQAEDLAFINRNLEIFWHMSRLGYEMRGRGVLIVDRPFDKQPEAHDTPHHLAYQPMSEVEHLFDSGVLGMVRMYDPAWEFVTVLFKGNRENTYRMRVLFANLS